MINKRLIGTVKGSKKTIALNVVFQWIALAANICMMASIALFLQNLFIDADLSRTALTLAVCLAAIAVRFICTVLSHRMSFESSLKVKKTLRPMIYKKLTELGSSYTQSVKTSEVVQVAVEGVDQLETYFGQYLPQFFYAMLAPLTLFMVLVFINWQSALVLLICVPLIPAAIAAVQTWAKKLLSKYWGQYTEMGDTFLENLQGLTTLKIYQSDGLKHEQMNEQAEKFRKITMKVLTMQLNSITIMDLIAYGGAALGMAVAISQYAAGHVSLAGCILIILLAADFFLPMRLLGSFFHIAMNGMAASDKIFNLLDLPVERKEGTKTMPENTDITISDLSFSYEKDREVLHDISMTFPAGSFTAVAGESGSGKSTVAKLLMQRNTGYSGYIKAGNTGLEDISTQSLTDSITYIGHNSYLFKGSVRDNLMMAKPDASDKEFWDVLEKTQLADFMRAENGLETELKEQASNLSGGQRQRLALARALLHDSPVYIFDEATSNIDMESENIIMDLISALAKDKTVIMISHRLANTVGADNIYVLENGNLAESGNHEELLAKNGVYANLYKTQHDLEQFGYASNTEKDKTENQKKEAEDGKE
jgi:ABC-type transport system involved in cytochrome bd biosynthesis fused ATPase/permease subunit